MHGWIMGMVVVRVRLGKRMREMDGIMDVLLDSLICIISDAEGRVWHIIGMLAEEGGSVEMMVKCCER